MLEFRCSSKAFLESKLDRERLSQPWKLCNERDGGRGHSESNALKE